MRLPHSLAWMLALIHLVSVSAFAQQTPPIPPKVVDVTVPPPVTVPGVTAPGDVPNRPLTADEAARIALRHQYQVTEARAGFNAAQGRTQQQKSALGPSVNVSAGYIDVQTLSSPSGTGGGTSAAAGLSTTGFNGDVTLRQLIFDFNHTRDLVRQSQALERSAAQNLTNVQTNVVFQVKQAYYSYAQSIALEAVDEDDLKNRNSQRDLARARLNSGLGLPSDVVAAETAVDEAITTLNQARANVTLARITLALDMGIDPRTPIVIGTTGEPALGTDNVDALVNTGLKQRPDVLQAIENLRAAQYAVSAARTTNAPSFSGNVQYGTHGDVLPPGTNTVTVGVSVVWTPFDSGLTAGRVKEARANVDLAQAQLLGVQQGVVSDITQAYVNFRSAEQRVVSARGGVANATEQVRIAEGRFRSGLGQFQDILTAQAALVTARSEEETAIYAREQARAALSRAIGAPLP